jgi:hypothetical protein
MRKLFPSAASSSVQRLLATAAAALCLTGCGTTEHTSVTVAYLSDSGPNSAVRNWHFSGPSKKQVETAFQSFSEKYGYRCRAHRKRVDEITCRGPKDLHLTFMPSLNRAEFVADFSWLDSSNRSHKEFVHHVADFKKTLAAAVGSENVSENKTG